MNETNEHNEPETFADAITKLRTFGAWQDHDRIDAVVAAHEREVAELRSTIESRAIIAATSLLDGETAKLNATIAELKHLNIEHCKDAKLAADEMQKKDATIAELKEALRKIAEDGGSGCIAAEPCPFVGDEDRDCNTCAYGVDVFARAALEKTDPQRLPVEDAEGCL